MDEPSYNDLGRKKLEGSLGDFLKRTLERGLEKAGEAPDSIKQFMHERKLPKELTHALLSQFDETKSTLLGLVSKEVRGFLERTNLAEELHKLLTGLQFEVHTTVRFRPNETREKSKLSNKEKPDPLSVRPEVDIKVHGIPDKPSNAPKT